MMSTVRAALDQGRQALDAFISDEETLAELCRAGDGLVSCLRSGGRIFSCGNGGSMSDAMHFAEELSGRFRHDRAPLPATAMSDPGHLSCVANDYGYEEVFSRYVLAHGRSGDVLLAISTSGSSPNVIRAAEQALAQGMFVIGLVGSRNCSLARHCRTLIAVSEQGYFADRIQELHIKCIHILIELVEQALFPGPLGPTKDSQ